MSINPMQSSKKVDDSFTDLSASITDFPLQTEKPSTSPLSEISGGRQSPTLYLKSPLRETSTMAPAPQEDELKLNTSRKRVPTPTPATEPLETSRVSKEKPVDFTHHEDTADAVNPFRNENQPAVTNSPQIIKPASSTSSFTKKFMIGAGIVGAAFAAIAAFLLNRSTQK